MAAGVRSPLFLLGLSASATITVGTPAPAVDLLELLLAEAHISAQELEYMREEVRASLPDTCAILRAEKSSDQQGGYVEEWAQVYQDVPCRISQSQQMSENRIVSNRTFAMSTWDMTLPYDADVSERDRIIHKAVPYEVLFVNGGRSYDTARRLVVHKLS
jgi:head-tail adaptor